MGTGAQHPAVFIAPAGMCHAMARLGSLRCGGRTALSIGVLSLGAIHTTNTWYPYERVERDEWVETLALLSLQRVERDSWQRDPAFFFGREARGEALQVGRDDGGADRVMLRLERVGRDCVP